MPLTPGPEAAWLQQGLIDAMTYLPQHVCPVIISVGIHRRLGCYHAELEHPKTKLETGDGFMSRMGAIGKTNLATLNQLRRFRSLLVASFECRSDGFRSYKQLLETNNGV